MNLSEVCGPNHLANFYYESKRSRGSLAMLILPRKWVCISNENFRSGFGYFLNMIWSHATLINMAMDMGRTWPIWYTYISYAHQSSNNKRTPSEVGGNALSYMKTCFLHEDMKNLEWVLVYMSVYVYDFCI